jgi:SAM-dependent methyltransferase
VAVDTLVETRVGLLENLREMERCREAYWQRYPFTSPIRLRFRAQAARHALHITAGESVLEIGAGSGLWTSHLIGSLSDSSITVAVFNDDLADQATARCPVNTKVVHVGSFDDFRTESYDYVIGTAILSHDRYQETLDWIASLLKPGGQLLFFEANYWNPQVFVKAQSVRLAARSGNANCQIALRKAALARAIEGHRFVDSEIVPFDILHPRTPRAIVPAVRSAAFVAEHLPGIREICGTLFISAMKPGPPAVDRPRADLAHHAQFNNAVSVVVPCHNEAMNIAGLVRALTQTYDSYIREIVLVNDNSDDDTVAVVNGLAEEDARVRLVNRTPPPGVGRALRDGFAATTGDYILSMDCDFEMLVPELRDLFDAVAAGHDGAIGSRFSYESVLLNYPAAKMLGNRAFHVLVRLLLRRRVRDISNNLKLYRGDILRGLQITQDGFAANAETGLKPLLAGHDIEEVPSAWINRDSEMGVSTFNVIRVAPGYAVTLARMLRRYFLGRRVPETAPADVRSRSDEP